MEPPLPSKFLFILINKKRANFLERCIVDNDCFCSLEDPDETVIVIKSDFRHDSDMFSSSTNMELAWTLGGSWS